MIIFILLNFSKVTFCITTCVYYFTLSLFLSHWTASKAIGLMRVAA